MNILVTGMSGLIGGLVRERLESRERLSALNRQAVDGIPTTQADLADYDAFRPAFDGQEAWSTWRPRQATISDELLQTNIVGTRNVLEAANDAGCKRVIFASSGATVAGWEQVEPYKALAEARYERTWHGRCPLTTWPTRPRGVYGAEECGENHLPSLRQHDRSVRAVHPYRFRQRRRSALASEGLRRVVLATRHYRGHRALRVRARGAQIRCSVRELPQPMGVPRSHACGASRGIRAPGRCGRPSLTGLPRFVRRIELDGRTRIGIR